MFIGGFLGIYIIGEESKTTNNFDSSIEHDPKTQVVNRGESRITLNHGF